MMNGMMDMPGMMWGMGLAGLLVVTALVLAIVALAKYIFFGDRRKSVDE